ncbi:hypothetical protein COLO4_01724, partial [Corchorus olitorius]
MAGAVRAFHLVFQSVKVIMTAHGIAVVHFIYRRGKDDNVLAEGGYLGGICVEGTGVFFQVFRVVKLGRVYKYAYNGKRVCLQRLLHKAKVSAVQCTH